MKTKLYRVGQKIYFPLEGVRGLAEGKLLSEYVDEGTGARKLIVKLTRPGKYFTLGSQVIVDNEAVV